MSYFKELGKVFLKEYKPILTVTGVIWYFWPLIKAILYAVYIIIKELTIDNMVEFIIKATEALVPRIFDLFLNPVTEIMIAIVIFFIVLNTYWLVSKISK